MPGPRPGGPTDFTPMPVWLGVVMLAAVLALCLWILFRELRNRKPFRLIIYLIGWMLLAIGAFIGAIAPIFSDKTFHYIVSRLGLHLTQVAMGALVLFFGWGAHKFKQTSKLSYGYVEVMFGTVSAIAIVSRINFVAIDFRSLTLTQYVALVGSSYVVARGLNNISEGRQEDRQRRAN